MSKPLPKISTALAKPTAAAPASWLALAVPREGSGSRCSLDGVSRCQLGAQRVAQGQPTFLSLRAVTPRPRSWRPVHSRS